PGAAFTTHEGLMKAPGTLVTAAALHREKRAHAMLGVDLTSNGWAATAAARALGLPVANLAIGSDVMWRPRQDPRLQRRLRWVARRSDLLLGVSEQLCARLRALVGDAAPIERVYVGRDCVSPMQPAQLRALRAAHGIDADALVVVYGGRLTTEKGMGELLQITPPLLARHPRLHLVCLGDGPLRPALQALSADRVHCPGWVDPAAFDAWLAASDLLVFPSRSEGLPQTVLEAMDRGLAVVATDVGGIPEAVVDGETGALVPPADAAALSAALEPFLRDAKLRARAGAAGKRRAATVFDPDANARHMAELLRGMITAHATRRLA
ncbi:MAG: glycosyltransferase family 4 protein, partial [Myxococcales bacterium]